MKNDSMLLTKIEGHFPDSVIETRRERGESMVRVKREDIIDILLYLRDDEAMSFQFLMDVTAVDWPGRDPRFEIVYHLYSLTHTHRLRVKSDIPEKDPVIDSATSVWKGANWFEREVWDMYGISFNGHPDLRRILMYEDFEGHPLRKDYRKDKRQPTVPSLSFPDPRKDVRRVIKASDLKRGTEEKNGGREGSRGRED